MSIAVYNDRVYTSYFAVVGRYVTNNRQVSISVSSPSWFHGECYEKLRPTVRLFNGYKSGEYTTEEFREIYYRDVLNKLNPKEVYEALKGKVICCWEKRGDFCHRHIVLEWLERELGKSVVGEEL